MEFVVEGWLCVAALSPAVGRPSPDFGRGATERSDVGVRARMARFPIFHTTNSIRTSYVKRKGRRSLFIGTARLGYVIRITFYVFFSRKARLTHRYGYISRDQLFKNPVLPSMVSLISSVQVPVADFPFTSARAGPVISNHLRSDVSPAESPGL